MRRRFSRFTRRSVIGALVGLAFAAAAGVGLAQITAGSPPSLAAASTTQTTGTTIPRESASADQQDAQGDQNSQGDQDQGNLISTGLITSTTTSSTTSTSVSTTTTGQETEGASGLQKVAVCHKTGSGKDHTINIAEPAVPAHLAHDDTVGECTPTTSTTQASTSTATTTTSQTTTTSTSHHGKKPKTQHVSTHGSSSSSHGHSGTHRKSGTHGNSGSHGHGNSGSHGNGGKGHGHGK